MRNRWLTQFALLTLLPITPIASADIYKCAGENGLVVYKNFPCAVESIGSSATATAPKEPAATPEPASSAPARKPAGAKVATAVQTSGVKREPFVGMSAADLKNSTWGQPIDVIPEEVVEGINKTWVYSGSRKVVLGASGRVISVAP